MMHPIVSIIVPCYNQGRYLSEAIDSVLAQTMEDWELIIVDDESTDNSAIIANKYCQQDSRIKYVYQENAGPSAARNHGARYARSKYLVFLDGDDKLAKGYIETGMKYMESHQECTLFYTNTEYFGGLKGTFSLHYTTYESLLYCNSIVCTCVLRKSDFDRVGGFDENMHGYEDWDFFIRLLYKNDHVYQDPHILFFYRKGVNENSVNAKANAKRVELIEYIFQKHHDKFVELFGSPYKAYSNAYLYKTELDKLLSSNAYKVGKTVLAPFRWLKHKYRSIKL